MEALGTVSGNLNEYFVQKTINLHYEKKAMGTSELM